MNILTKFFNWLWGNPKLVSNVNEDEHQELNTIINDKPTLPDSALVIERTIKNTKPSRKVTKKYVRKKQEKK